MATIAPKLVTASEVGPAMNALARAMAEPRGVMFRFLQDALKIPSVSGQEKTFTEFVAQWAAANGFQTDLWQAEESQLPPGPAPFATHLPLHGRPTLVIKLAGTGRGPSLLFNAHSDVVGPGDVAAWTVPPFSGTFQNDRFISRGACDVKGPLASALWCMLALKHCFGNSLPGDVLLELIPGEEDAVGLGTLTSVARGHRADAVIILEPTENLPRPASRAGCRFVVTLHGRAVHGTVKWLGKDALALAPVVMQALAAMEQAYNHVSPDALFAEYPYQRPITLDSINGGRWQGMVCDECVLAGYLELLPRDDIQDWKKRFTADLLAGLPDADARGRVAVAFTEEYHGHVTDVQEAVCRAAMAAVAPWQDCPWAGFNSGCEAGVRWFLHGTPTLVWGPGTLGHAHAADESIGFSEVANAAELFARTCVLFSGHQETKC